MTVNKDAKHITKRIRNRAIGTGFKVGPILFNQQLLTRLMKLFDCHKQGYLQPADKQNVALAYQLLCVIYEISCKPISAYPDGTLQHVIPELKILGSVLEGITSLYAKFSADLETILHDLSRVAHLIFYAYRENGTGFVPGPLYYDVQDTIRDVYSTVAKMQLFAPDKPLFLYQLGSDEVEQLFSAVHTMTHDRGCDILQLIVRLQHAATVRALSLKHPEWKAHASRRLNIKDGIDHTSPRHWTGTLKPGAVDLEKCWNVARIQALALLADCKWYKPHGSDVDMLRPKGFLVGCRENGSGVDLEDPDEEEEDEDEAIVEERDQDMELEIHILLRSLGRSSFL